jgi:uncharacterized repeat protein (TIGR01451 family)
MLKRRLLALSILFAVPLLVVTASQVLATPATPGFHAPVNLPGSNNGSEPSLAISDDGVRYPSWQSPGEFAKSADGVNFTQSGITPVPDSGAAGDVTNAISYSGALYNGQICGLPTELHSCIYRSVDGGSTWTVQNRLADNHPGASDRPWIDVYPKKNTTPTATDPSKDRVYLEFHTFSPDDLVYVTTSTDGGATFGPAIPIEAGTNSAIPDSGCNTIPGGITVDQDTGTVYALWLSGNDVASNVVTGCNYSQIGPFNKAWVSVSTDGGTTWTPHLAWQGAFNAVTKIGDNADKIFSTITVDSAHQIHIALSVRHNDDPVGFVAQCQVNQGNCSETPQATDFYLVTSPDDGVHWTLPFQVNKTTGSFFFPWLAAGSAGIVDVSYYSSTTLQPNKPSSVWFAGFSQITGALARYVGGPNATYTSTPVATDEILLNPSAIHGNGTSGGGICTFGIFCSAVPGANRGLADVFEVHVDPAGGGNVAWTKDLGSKVIQFACQDSGASAFAGAPDLNGCYGPADMSIAKSDSPDPVGPGQNLTYHLTVANNGVAAGPSTTSGVTVTDTLPAGVTLVSKTPSTGSCSGTTTISCALGIFPGGASATIDIVVTVSPSAGNGTTLTNTARVSAVTADPNSTNNTAAASTTVVSGADLSLVKTDSPDPVSTGHNLTYTLTVHNGGPLAAGGVSITDQLPRNTAFGTASATQGSCSFTQPAKRIVTCTLGTIPSGGTVTATIVVTPPSKKTTLTNTATVSSTTNDPDPANNSASATTSVVP